ncbi:hypothetical protein [Kaarinaea lacus]
MLSERFAPLKNMEQFTDEMFNRIIAFQEKEHAAWNSDMDFAKRIAGLPLHYLIFSNPDRDPTKYGPTIAPYYPLREEMQKIAAYAKQVSGEPKGIDWYPGNGFLGSLLAREGLNISGIKNNISKPNQISSFFDNSCYTFIERENAQTSSDLVFASWVPSQKNPTQDIIALSPKLIVYVYTEHVDQSSNTRQTGTDDMFDLLSSNYYLLDTWTVNRPKDLLHEPWPDMTPSIEENRITKIYASNDCKLAKITNIEDLPVYDWEKELQMALLTIEAKQDLRSRGINV